MGSALQTAPATSRRSLAETVFRGDADSTSFGPIGRISQVKSERLKGLVGYYVSRFRTRNEVITPITTAMHAQFIADVVKEGIQRISEGDNTRLSIRTIAAPGMMPMLTEQVRRAGGQLEAQIPLNANYTLVYIGYNDPSRELSSELMMAYRANVSASSMRVANKSHYNSAAYSIRIIDGEERSFSGPEKEDIYCLLRTFGHTRQSAIQMIEDGMNIIGLAYTGDGRVAGMSITERRAIELSDGTRLNIAELTDGVVAHSARGNSLYSTILNEVYAHIHANRREIAIVYAESNVSSMPLLRAAVDDGRVFDGILPNHHRIINPRTGELELKSMVITYMTMAQIGSMLEQRQDAALREAARS